MTAINLRSAASRHRGQRLALFLRIQALIGQQEIEPIDGIFMSARRRYRNRKAIRRELAGQRHRDHGVGAELGVATILLYRLDDESHLARFPFDDPRLSQAVQRSLKDLDWFGASTAHGATHRFIRENHTANKRY
jgi:hypothetical protein